MIYPDLDYCMYYFCSALKSLFVKTNGGGGGNTTTKKWLFRVETLNEKHSHGKVRCAHMYTRRATTTTTKVIIINLKSV